ncbi:uncharacterized protein DSM5745_10700 [Aspergillus mulundensis]|uniref:Uncharacterized protein n=1 Tax=Aspergillus mulundensis TaxID=1810919 RepID=A0A3D8QHA2_9EURO|nr:Uncharacterized protein DSM5745_10700 [Aspergillus mulundensis]RDW61202.1 Uncharacterized protein DSM5745_10700 [Aspergillus mulundensis]
MGRGKKKVLSDFIDSIPDEKLEGFPDSPSTLYHDLDFRFDMQGITSNDEWNLQIQVNFKPKTPSLRKFAPKTVAGPVLVSRSEPLTGEEIRQALRDTVRFE